MLDEGKREVKGTNSVSMGKGFLQSCLRYCSPWRIKRAVPKSTPLYCFHEMILLCAFLPLGKYFFSFEPGGDMATQLFFVVYFHKAVIICKVMR